MIKSDGARWEVTEPFIIKKRMKIRFAWLKRPTTKKSPSADCSSVLKPDQKVTISVLSVSR